MSAASRPPAHRLVAMLVVLVVAFGVVVVRLATLQVGDRGALSRMGTSQRTRTIELPAARGQILDRDGTQLAVTREARDVYVNPTLVTDPLGQADVVAEILDLEPRDVRAAFAEEGTFVYLRRQVDVETADDLEAQRLPGIGFLEVPQRYYPAGPLASQVLGFVNVDGVGIAGLEDQYQRQLAGTPGERTAELSADGLPITTGDDTVVEPVPGTSIVTTFDRQMQYMVQTALERAVRDNGALGGTVIVMDPREGDVYAMATYPTFDPNHFADAPPEAVRNRAVTDAFEPGSVNKIITAASALEVGAVGLEQRFQVPAAMQVGQFRIEDAHVHPVQTMTLGDIIVESSNIGSAMIATEVGNGPLGTYMERFGYGRQTGVGFPGEASGVLVPASQWDEVIRATVSYGQGVSVTPLQMAGVYATIANDGERVQPRLVRGFRTGDGAFEEAPTAPPRRVVRSGTAEVLTRMLAAVVEDGTGAEAQIPGYQVAGKTGTSRKVDESGRYVQRYMASFVGFLPAGDPRVVIAVSIDEPRTMYGGLAAAPLFQEVARHAIQRLSIPAASPVPLPPLARNVP